MILMHHIVRHGRLKNGVAAEHHDIEEMPTRDLQPFRQHIDVAPVLSYGILEPVLF